MLNNPEFHRNRWLRLTGTQLAVHPALFLILVTLCIVLRGPDDTATDVIQTIQKVLAIVLNLLLIVGGTMAATASIRDEVAERTWDQQRLSALSPWQMAWGKLLGGTIHIWYGSAFYIAGLVACALLLDEPARLSMLTGTLLSVVALHAISMAASLHMLDPNGRGAAASGNRSMRGLVGLFLILLLMMNAPVFMLLAVSTKQYAELIQQPVSWWFWQWPQPTLMLFISAQTCALALLALWRTMRTQLLVPATPWAWVLGSVWLAVLWAGLENAMGTQGMPPAARLAFMLVLQSLALAYIMLGTQKNTLLHWKTVAFHLRRRAWRRGLELLPLWPISLLLALLGVAVLAWIRLDPPDTAIDGNFLVLALLLGCLHTLRNAGIYLLFAWRRTSRSPVGLTILTYFLLSVIFPLFTLVGDRQLGLLSEPMLVIAQDHSNWSLAFVAMGMQLASIAALLVRRWRSYQSLDTTAPAATPQTA